MKNYLRWSLRQLYLLFFWPTQFRREVNGGEGQSAGPLYRGPLHSIAKMLPWTAALAAACNLIGGYVHEAGGGFFNWGLSWFGVAVGIAGGLLLGALGGFGVGAFHGLEGIVAGGIAYSAAFGAAFGLVGGMSSEGLAGVVITVALCTALGVVFSVAPYEGSGRTYGAFYSVVFGMVNVVEGRGGISSAALFFMLGPLVFGLVFFRLISYPFDAAISAVTYLVGRWRPRAVRKAWRLCPVVWNERIVLPLPFASRLLVLLLEHDREEGFRQITFVAAERELQRSITVTALAEITIGDLKSDTLAEIPAVSERLSWTLDAATELPRVLSASLPRFERAAQHISQYFTLHNAYRKHEALGRATEEVENLRRSLVAARGKYAPRLLRVANRWGELVDAEREKTRAQAEAAREIPNPFAFGNAVVETEENVFAGRRDIVRQIEASVLGAREAPTLLLHGPRRVGKTSILNQLPRLLGPDFAAAVVDCQNPAVTGSAGTLLRYLSRACSEGLRRRRVRVEVLAAAKLEREPFAVFDEWLDGVERAMPGGMRALLCLDEYERLGATLEAGWGGAFLDALRHTLQHRRRVVLMFTGAHTFGELGPEWTDRFISARRVRVSFLGREDVELLLREPIPEFDMKWAEGALEAVIAATGCQPFLTQAVAFELVQYLNEGQRKEATPEDVEAAIGRALVSGGEYFANVWSDAGAEGQAVLRAVAAGETPPEAQDARVWLREHDVLDADGGFAVEMVRRWVLSKTARV